MNAAIEFVQNIFSAYNRQCKPLCRELNIPQTALDILLFLANNPECSSASDIVEIRKIKANIVSVNVEKLVCEGYLKREAVKGDRRKVMLVYTEKAIPIIEKGRKIQTEFFQNLFENVTEQQKNVFLETMKIISQNADRIMEDNL